MAGQLIRFSPDEIILDEQDAWYVLEYFFSGVGQTPSDLTEDDIAFAQAILVEVIDRSYQVFYTQALWTSAMESMRYLKSKNFLKKIIKEFVEDAEEHWFRSPKTKREKMEKMFKEPIIYDVVRSELVRKFRSAWKIRLETGEPVPIEH